jgi:hypothetical protein
VTKTPPHEDITEVATRVLNKTATPEEVETVALWSLHVSKYIRTLAAREGK